MFFKAGDEIYKVGEYIVKYMFLIAVDGIYKVGQNIVKYMLRIKLWNNFDFCLTPSIYECKIKKRNLYLSDVVYIWHVQKVFLMQKN